MSKKIKLLIILGPTASGKSAFAVELARKIGGEIISADSRQIYKGLDIGTGKVTSAEMKKVPHYLLDVADPKKTFTVTDYVSLAEKAITEISNRGNIPIICGGTGFYIQALVDGLILPDVPPNEKLRERLNKKTTVQLFGILKNLDPVRAKNIDQNNPHRLIRAIEIATELGKVPKLKAIKKYDTTFIGLNIPHEKLKVKIHKRLIARIESGMLKEVQTLHAHGLSWKRMEDLGLEYRYISRHLRGLISLPEMISELEMEICHYAKRQMTWFKRDKRINWIETPISVKNIAKLLHRE